MSLDGLDGWLRARADADEFSGVVLVRRGAETVFEGAYGWGSRRWPVPVTMGTRFDNASMTKVFTAVAALRLVDAGRLGLEDRITDLVDLSGTTIASDVTIRHLLTHTSGIADDADEESGEVYADLFVDKPCYSIMETRDFLPQFVHKPPNFPAGEGCRYCNVGYVLVGLAIESVTGTSYRDHVLNDLFPAAGLTSSGFFDRRDAAGDVAEGWDLVDGAWQQNIFGYPPIGSPDGGAQVTAADQLTFWQAALDGDLLSPKTRAWFGTPQVLHDRDEHGVEVHYGFGIVFVIDAGGTVREIYKEGTNPGVSGIMQRYPALGLDVVVLSNMEHGAWEPIRNSTADCSAHRDRRALRGHRRLADRGDDDPLTPGPRRRSVRRGLDDHDPGDRADDVGPRLRDLARHEGSHVARHRGGRGTTVARVGGEAATAARRAAGCRREALEGARCGSAGEGVGRAPL